MGLKIWHKIFLKMLHEFESDGQLAIKNLLNTRTKYVKVVLYKFFHYKNNDIPPIQPYRIIWFLTFKKEYCLCHSMSLPKKTYRNQIILR